MDSLLSILGSIASIGGAYYAYRQARRSRKYATEAQNLRDELINRRKLIEVSQVHSETNRILKVVSKVGPTSTVTSIKGINVTSISQDVEEYSRYLNSQHSHFSELFRNRAAKLCKSLNPDIEKLSESMEFEDIKSAGKSIYYKINDFLPLVKSLTDEKKEQSSTFQD